MVGGGRERDREGAKKKRVNNSFINAEKMTIKFYILNYYNLKYFPMNYISIAEIPFYEERM